jgi:hypothetical protein
MRIVDNGVFRVGKDGAGEITLLGSGIFGGATLVVGYLTNRRDTSTFHPIPEIEGTVIDDFSVTVTKGGGTYGAVSVTGGTGINIEIVDNSY